MRTTDVKRPNLNELREGLRIPLQQALDGVTEHPVIEYLCEPKDVADDPAKLLVTDAKGRKTAIVLVSAPMDSEMVGRGMRLAAQAKQALGGRLGRVVLKPLAEGTLDGLSYTILPFRSPIDDGRIMRRYWRWRLRHRVLEWLADANEATTAATSSSEVGSAFEQPLQHLTTLDDMDSVVRDAAYASLERLEVHDWKPLFVLMHGDLWVGNLLHAAREPGAGPGHPPAPFVLIDWPGAQLRGYPFYDLLRIARSMKLGREALRREVVRHCRILGIGPSGAMGLMLSSLGHLGLHLGFFPPETFAQLSLSCFEDLREALSGLEEPRVD